MSGGIAYVYDPDRDFAQKCNMAMVALEPVLSSADQEAKVERAIWHSAVRGGASQTDEAILKGLIERHFKYTGSTRARNLLDDWATARSMFVKVFPSEYKRALGEMDAAKNAKSAKEKIAA
jgi:glutamate synthase (NADPH/NADH) large chain